MNKEELQKLLKTLKIDKEEFWILSSGALVLRNLLSTAGDLDIAVTDKGLAQLKNNYDLVPKGNGWYVVGDKIECVCDGKKENLKYFPEKHGEYYLQNIEEYLDYLNNSKRKKDKQRIGIVEEYLKHINHSENK